MSSFGSLSSDLDGDDSDDEQQGKKNKQGANGGGGGANVAFSGTEENKRAITEYMRKLKGLFQKAKQEAYDLMRILYFDHKYPTTTRILRTYLQEEDQKSKSADEFVSFFWSTIRTGKLKEGKFISQELEALFAWNKQKQDVGVNKLKQKRNKLTKPVNI